MKKPKEFWVDSGYLDDSGGSISAMSIIQADATSAAIGMAALLIVGFAIGIFNPAVGIVILGSPGSWATIVVGAVLTSIGVAVEK